MGNYRRKKTSKVKKMSKDITILKRAQNKKYIDIPSGALNVTATGTVQWLSFSKKGTNSTERNGINILLRNLQMRYSYVQDASDENKRAFLRVTIFKDKDSGNAKPTISGLYETTDVLSPLDRDAAGQYIIMYDRLHKVVMPFWSNDGTLEQIGEDAFIGKVNRRLNLKCTYNDNVAVQSTGVGAERNQLYIAVLGSTANMGVFEFNSRITFTD